MEEDLSSIFGGNQENAFKILNNLISPENVSQITDLNMDKIRVLTIIKWNSLLDENNKLKFEDRKTPMQLLDVTLEYYKQLLCSLGRKSRIEVIDAIKNINEKFIQQEQNISGLLGGSK